MMKRQNKPLVLQSNEAGFTIIESLVALLVAAILLTAIAPVIVLSVATRVQAKRIELATDAAKGYIDGVKAGTIAAPPPSASVLSGYSAPTTGNLTCSKSSDYCSSPSADLFCVNGDSDDGCTINSNKDLVVQAFRYNKTSGAEAKNGYQLGVRVYRADAFKSGITLKASKDFKDSKTNEGKEQTFTGGTGLKTIQAPLVEMTTDISGDETTFRNLCDRLGGCQD